MVVCTLCSCYPWPVLGLPPVWYKSAPYRSRAVNDPRGVLADFGVTLPADTEIRVWDSTAEIRYLVLPMRPDGTEGWSEDRLAELVTRDRMIGTGLPKQPAGARDDGAHDMGGVHGFGKVAAGTERAGVPRRMGRPRVRAARCAMAMPGEWNIDMSRFARENRRPADYLSMSYYEIWLAALETHADGARPGQRDEIEAGHALQPPKPVKRGCRPTTCSKVLHRGGPTEREPARRARSSRATGAREEH